MSVPPDTEPTPASRLPRFSWTHAEASSDTGDPADPGIAAGELERVELIGRAQAVLLEDGCRAD